MSLVERLRNGRDGWSGDAACIEAETGDEAASVIEALTEALKLARTWMVGSPPQRGSAAEPHYINDLDAVHAALVAAGVPALSTTDEVIHIQGLRRMPLHKHETGC